MARKYTNVILFKVTPEMRARVERLAEQESRSLSSMARVLLNIALSGHDASAGEQEQRGA